LILQYQYSDFNYRKAFGTSPDFGAGKTEVFSGKSIYWYYRETSKEIIAIISIIDY
jgi:hypothetical protein